MTQPAQTYDSSDAEITDFIVDVRNGLSQRDQKTLDPKYFYDHVGSALFEVITLLPEYGVTRADERLIDRHVGQLADRFESDVVVAELGSGAGTKTRRILSEIAKTESVTYFPIDVSRAALERCQQALRETDGVSVEPLVASYIEGLTEAMQNVARDAQCHFFDAGSVTQTSKVDGVHLDEDQHLRLGVALAVEVKRILHLTKR